MLSPAGGQRGRPVEGFLQGRPSSAPVITAIVLWDCLCVGERREWGTRGGLKNGNGEFGGPLCCCCCWYSVIIVVAAALALFMLVMMMGVVVVRVVGRVAEEELVSSSSSWRLYSQLPHCHCRNLHPAARLNLPTLPLPQTPPRSPL